MAFVFGVYGLVIGSFVAMCLYRLPREESVLGRSRCPVCGHQLAWYELIPVVSYLALGGHCRYCQASIAWRYPLVEGVMALLFVAVYYRYGVSGQAVIFCVVLAILVIISGMDYDTMMIADRWNWLLAGCGLLLVWSNGEYAWQQIILGAVIVSLPLALLERLTGWIGGGDVKMMAALGIVLGPRLVVLDFVIGSVSAAVVSVTLVVMGKLDHRSPIPWGPFLAFGAMIAILLGDELMEWYLRRFVSM